LFCTWKLYIIHLSLFSYRHYVPQEILAGNMNRRKLSRTHDNRPVRKDIFTAFWKINLCDVSQDINIHIICSTKACLITTFSGWFISIFEQSVALTNETVYSRSNRCPHYLSLETQRDVEDKWAEFVLKRHTVPFCVVLCVSFDKNRWADLRPYAPPSFADVLRRGQVEHHVSCFVNIAFDKKRKIHCNRKPRSSFEVGIKAVKPSVIENHFAWW
jgi:hypothetical protein